jgi:heptosyltransferase-1
MANTIPLNPSPSKILWIRLTSLGDVVHTLPALHDLWQLGFRVEVLTEPEFAPIYHHHPAFASPNSIRHAGIRALKKKPLALIASVWRLRRQLKAQQYDGVIDSQGLWKSALIAWRIAKRVIGGSRESVREDGVWRLYRQTVAVDLSANVIHRYRELAYQSALLLGIPADRARAQRDSPPCFYPKSPAIPAPFNREPSFATRGNHDGARGTIMLLHGVSKFRRHKMLPTGHWQEITRRLLEQGYTVATLWFGKEGGGEHRFAKVLEKSGAMALPPRSIPELIALMLHPEPEEMPRLAGVISIDSGLGHLANALGLPTVMLFAPTSARRFGTAHLPHQRALSVDFHCAPCGLRQCQRNLESGEKTPPCWMTLSPETIVNTLQQSLDLYYSSMAPRPPSTAIT